MKKKNEWAAEAARKRWRGVKKKDRAAAARKAVNERWRLYRERKAAEAGTGS